MGNQSSALHNAAAHNDISKIEAMFQHQNVNVNERDKDGWTPLHFAAYGGALEVTQALLIRGANPEPKDKADRTPLHLAAINGHTTLGSLLIGKGAEVNAKDENDMTPLHKSAIKGQTDFGEQLLRLGADINAAVKDGTTALHLAAWKAQKEFAKLLLSRGANVQAVTKNGRTPLHDAAEAGDADIVQMLLSLGANPHAQDKDGEIPASLASHSGHKDIAELIARGGKTSAQSHGTSPSAPPLPQREHGGVTYPEVYQTKQDLTYQGKPVSEESAEKQRNKDFWNQNLGEKDKEKGRNQTFWGDLLGGGFMDPKYEKPKPNERQEEIARNKEFWDKKLAGGISGIQRPEQHWPDRAEQASHAWNQQVQDQPQQQKDPREQFQENLLKQAQGVWNMLQGKGGHDDEARREQDRRRQEAQRRDDGWGTSGQKTGDGWGKQSNVPTQELHDLKPFDEDAYDDTPAPKSGKRTAQDVAGMRRRIGELELQLDREQGWIRGGSKKEADDAKTRRDKIKEQEDEINELKRQLAGDKVTFGGRTGGKDLYSAAPHEYLCPITQEIMHDPVTAGDGYTYERGPIEQWIKSGHNTSPMTGGRLPKQDLVPNHDLRSAIKQWQNRKH